MAVSALRTNWAMLAWAGAAAAFVLGLVVIPPFPTLLHAGRVPGKALPVTFTAAVVVPLWLEVATRVHPAPAPVMPQRVETRH